MSSGSRSATSRKGGKAKSAKTKMDLDGSSSNIPSSSSAAGHSDHPDSNGAGSSFSPFQFAASDHTMYSLANPPSMSYHNSTNNPTVSYSDNRGHINWPSPISTGSFMPHFNAPHSPIASLAPHSTHTLPFTVLSRGSNEDVSIHNSNSLPYYYPPEWNRDDHDTPEWNRVDPPEWSRTDFVDNPSIDVPPSYSMDTTNLSPESSPSLLTPWEVPVSVSVTDGQAGATSSVSTMASRRGHLDGTVSSGDKSNADTVDSVLFGPVPTGDNATGSGVRMTQSRRDSTGQRRRQGVSYSVDEHQSMLQELLSPQPGISSSSSHFSSRPDDHSSSSRISTIWLGNSGRITPPDVLSDDYPTRRRSARVCPGRSRLDVLQHVPTVAQRDLAGASSGSGLLESDNSPVLPLEDIAGILSDIEQNNSEHRSQELQSDSRGHVATAELSTTNDTAGLTQPISNSEGSDVITISSDEVCVCTRVCV